MRAETGGRLWAQNAGKRPEFGSQTATHLSNRPELRRFLSTPETWGLGTYHGLRRTHVDTYLNEFVFRYNRRFHRHVSFEALLGLAAHHAPASYWDIVKRDNPRKGVQTIRRTPRRRKAATGMRPDGAPPALGTDHNQPIKPVHPSNPLPKTASHDMMTAIRRPESAPAPMRSASRVPSRAARLDEEEPNVPIVL